MHLRSLLVTVVAIAALATMVWYLRTSISVTSFEECADSGYPIMTSYPPQCRAPNGQIFTQDIGNELEKSNLVRVETPRPTAVVTSPISIIGQARGSWFFEASFQIRLEDLSGTPIVTTSAQAQGEWMTTEFVPFQAELTVPTTFNGPAILVLKKDNPSGLPENADELRIPITVMSNSMEFENP